MEAEKTGLHRATRWQTTRFDLDLSRP